MATVSFLRYPSVGTGYINAVDSQTINVTGSSFTWTPPTFTIYAALSANNNPTYRYLQMSSAIFRLPTASGGTNTTYLTSGQSGYTAHRAWSGAVGWTPASKSFTTSTFFNSSNSTTRTITGTLNIPYEMGLVATDAQSSSSYMYPTAEQTLTTVYVTLDAPPTFKVTDSGGTETTQVYYDTNFVYAGLTTASIKVANLSAKYGGSISSVAFTIGNQTVTRSDAGTLSILLNAGGTFTPKVTVTDSRGQTTTKTLDSITVNTYTAPSVSFDVARTLNDGTPDDEGTYGLIEAELTFTDVIATAVAPSVVMTDDDGTQTTPSVTWYTDSSLATQVTWANVSSGDTVYGLFSGLSTQHSYQVSVRPRDSEGTGTAVTQTIAPAFYTVDFLAGGHGIAFGKPASNTGFECAMTATFEDTATFGSDIYIDLSDYQTTGSVDKELYDAIVALGWDSDVLVS